MFGGGGGLMIDSEWDVVCFIDVKRKKIFTKQEFECVYAIIRLFTYFVRYSFCW